MKNDMKTEEIIHDLPKGLLKWYRFRDGGRALYVKAGIEADEALAESLSESGLKVDQTDLLSLDKFASEKAKETSERYDYIVMVGALEQSRNPEAALQAAKSLLNKRGRLLIGADNRLGIRYFCGDRDVFTDRNFDSIENYGRISIVDRQQLKGRAYAKAELAQMLESTGFKKYRFYAVLPDLISPQVLYAEDYLPEEELEVRIFPQYHYPDTVFLEEERLYTYLIQNGLFHAMANGYLIECPLDDSFANINQVTISMERGKSNAVFTIIRRDNKVEKKPVYNEGKKKLEQLMENTLYLREHGVKMVEGVLEENAFVMPYVKGVPVTNYFRKLLCEDTELFLHKLDYFWEVIQNSSEAVPYENIDWGQFGPNLQKGETDDSNKDKWKRIAFGSDQERENLGIILKRGYIDLVSLNCFCIDDEFVFYDQELYIENLPAKAILQRTINFIYKGDTRLEMILPKERLQERYHLNEYFELWKQFSSCFLNDLRNDTKLSQYHKMFRRDMKVINSNRQKINYSANEYERLFWDIFHGTKGRQIYLFGAGNFTKKFLSQFGSEYEIAGILDNNAEKWETEFSGIKIYRPEYIRLLPDDSYKVIVCIKNYVPIIKQLKELGAKNFSVYDSNMKYQQPVPLDISRNKGESKTPKKYHAGYIAGVFDLFHIGHLNMFKWAKEQCDYLIVGVADDECVMKNKEVTPYIPFEERIELVRACRYVDETVKILAEYNNTDEIYQRYQFDVQFLESDDAYNPEWLVRKDLLQRQGLDIVFFPYTQSTNSMKLRALIEK